MSTNRSLTDMMRKGLLIRLDDGSSVCCKIANSDPKEIAEEFESLDEEVKIPDQTTTEVKAEKKFRPTNLLKDKPILTFLCKFVPVALCVV